VSSVIPTPITLLAPRVSVEASCHRVCCQDQTSAGRASRPRIGRETYSGGRCPSRQPTNDPFRRPRPHHWRHERAHRSASGEPAVAYCEHQRTLALSLDREREDPFRNRVRGARALAVAANTDAGVSPCRLARSTRSSHQPTTLSTLARGGHDVLGDVVLMVRRGARRSLASWGARRSWTVSMISVLSMPRRYTDVTPRSACWICG
jgi:hypothetical protein